MSRGNLQRMQAARSRIKTARNYLTFQLADRMYAINLLYVREITGPQVATPISEVPSYVKGVFTKFDEIIPVIDLRQRLNLPVTPVTGDTSLIIIEIVQRLKITCALLVDAVEEISNIPASAINSEAQLSDNTELGTADLDAGPVTLLNIYRVLNPEEIPVIENTRALRVV
jgi:purine-binding chemotaxis protein CheW